MASVVVAIVGIAQYDDYGFVEKKVNKLLGNLTEKLREIIVSEERGASSLGCFYAQQKQIKHRVISADWEHNGKAAGFLRNAQIVAAAHQLIVFFDGKCHYTKDLIDKALDARKLVKIVRVSQTQQSFKLPETVDG